MKKTTLTILIMLAAMTSLSIDIYLPSMAAIAADLRGSIGEVQIGLSLFVLGFALGQLILGPFSDLYGRRRPLLAALALYLAGNLVCGFTTRMEVFLAARLLQGLGASCGAVSAMAIVRDQLRGPAMTRVLAKIATIVGIAPILAPNLGAFLEAQWSWRASFFFLAGWSLLLLAGVWKALPETRPPMSERLSAGFLLKYAGILKNPSFVLYTIVYAGAFAGLFAFIANASPLLIQTMGVSPRAFGLLFASNALAYMGASWLASRAASRLSLPIMALVGGAAMLLGGLLMAMLAGWQSPASLLLPMYVVTFGVAWGLPTGSGGALEPFPEEAGRASALQGALRFSAGALIGWVLSHFTTRHALPLGLAITCSGTLCVLAATMIAKYQGQMVSNPGPNQTGREELCPDTRDAVSAEEAVFARAG